MRSTRFWVALVCIMLALSCAGAVYVYSMTGKGQFANIYQDGKCLYSIDLAAVEESYTIEIDGAFENIILVEKGQIGVSHATCPDKVCVRQGMISTSVAPVVCLPNKLTIVIETEARSGFDGLSH